MSSWLLTSQSTSSLLRRAFSFYATLTQLDAGGGSGLKERVYGINGQNPLPAQPAVDPAVALAIQMRERRTEARALAERDPSLARDLHIGRPDLGGNYRDGGLIELNSAPTDVIVKVAGIDLEGAERIVNVRQEWSGGFTSIEEVIVYAQVADGDAAVLRDRGMVLPR